MSRKEMTAEQFRVDVANHEMAVRLDNGLYRHLVFRAPKNSWNHWLEVVTWPGCLTINGDMGSWTFSRVEDMFNFFRHDELKINPHYWCKKLRAGAGSDGIDLAKEFDEDEFEESVFGQLADYFSDEPDRVAAITEALKEDLLYQDNEHDQKRAVCDFKYDGFQFDGIDIPSGKVWSYHYLWCCYAIVWAIQQYDKLPQSRQPK